QAARSPKSSPLTRAVPPTSPSAGVRAIRSSSSRRPRWAAIAKRPYSTKLPASTRSATFSRAVRPPPAWRRSTASVRAWSSVSARRASSSARSSRSAPPSGIWRLAAEAAEHRERVGRALGVGDLPAALDRDLAAGRSLAFESRRQGLGAVLGGATDDKLLPAAPRRRPLGADHLGEAPRLA